MTQTVKVQRFTPNKSTKWLTDFPYEHQRKISPAHVAKLARAMANNTFGVTTIERCDLNGRKFLTNGQHTLSAIVTSGITQNLPAVIHKVTSMEEVREWFYRGDIGKSRSVIDMYRAMGLPEKFGMVATDLNRFGGAVALAMVGLSGGVGNIDIDERLEAMHDWYKYAKQYLSLIESPTMNKGLLMRRDCFTIGMITCRDSKEEANDFWPLVASGDKLGRYDIREIYRRWLVSSQGVQNFPRHMGLALLLRYSAQAWNAWHDGKERKRLSVRSSRGPVILKGTRFAER